MFINNVNRGPLVQNLTLDDGLEKTRVSTVRWAKGRVEWNEKEGKEGPGLTGNCNTVQSFY